MVYRSLVGGGLDLGFQLYKYDGRIGCVNWGQVAGAALLGAIGGEFFAAARGGFTAAEIGVIDEASAIGTSAEFGEIVAANEELVIQRS